MKNRTVFLVALLSIIAGVALMALACIVGCTTTTTGGEQRHTQHGTHLVIDSPTGATLAYDDDGNCIATTQPSASSNSGNLPRITAASEGQLSGVSFDQVKSNFANAWPVAILFLVAAAGLWILAGNRLASIACGACAVLTLLFPQAMIFAAIAVLVFLVWSVRDRIKQLVRGNQNALQSLNPDDAKQAKVLMEAKHDQATKRVVAGLKA